MSAADRNFELLLRCWRWSA